ncbi:MAG: AAA family ATPase [Actinobacteria bacterium]|nr:AAA family ATPase [Actinomycetota bacterium]MSY22678.1 AAA family ATPase [Actinomycetota bacterium]
MEFRLLGSVDVIDGSGPVPLGGPRQRLLLASLLATRRQVVSLDWLTEALWGEDAPSTARSTLQTSVSKLRRLFSTDPLVTLNSRPPGYLLDLPLEAVDADCFESYLAAARQCAQDRPEEALELFDRALGLWAGPAFAGFEDLPWAQPEATRLEELRLQALEDRNEARLALGDEGAVVSELEGLARAYPLRERLWCLLMSGLNRSGRQAEALRVSAEFRRHLGEELGLDPSPAFAELEGRIAVGEPGHTRPTATTQSTHSTQPRQLSAALVGPLVGREMALDEIEAAVARARLVTLTGPGGVGKSTLANEAARRLAASFRDGVRVIELAPVADPAAVVAAVAKSVQAERRSERTLRDAVVEVLAPQELLLVIDNCEHVIGAVGELLGELIRWCPSVSVLATSRSPIGMAGEVVRPVAPLMVPSDRATSLTEIAGAASVKVFVARAADASPGFELTEENAQAVAELCIQLDGLPLALELAAARMGSMTPSQLVDRLTERFALLGSGHGREERHRSLRDVVQWSYVLLDSAERELFNRLSVFAGGFDLVAAERTCSGGEIASEDLAYLLSGLVDKSLVVASQSGGQFRYSQLETLRQFGNQRLAEQADGLHIHRAHLATFTELSVSGALALEGPEERQWSIRLNRDADNLRSALTTAIAVDDADSALRIVVSMSEPGFRAIRYEVVDWAETVAAMDSAADHPLRPTALAVVGYGAFVRGELDRAVELADQAIGLRSQHRVESCGMPERVLGNALFYQGHSDTAVEWMNQMVDVARDTGRIGRLAHALYMRSVAQTSIGDPDGGARWAEEAQKVSASLENPTALSQAAYAAGLAAAHSNPVKALRLLEESAELADSVGNLWLRSFARTEAMWLRAMNGEIEEALGGYREVIGTWFRGGDWANQWLSLRHVAGILASRGRDEEAALLSGALRAAGAAAALPFAPLDADELAGLNRELATRLGEDALAAASSKGASMRADAAVALTLAAIDSVLSSTT